MVSQQRFVNEETLNNGTLNGDDVWNQDDDGTFEDYETKTVDPGPWLLAGTVAIALLLMAAIPLLVWIGSQLGKRRKRLEKQRQEQLAKENTESGSSDDYDKTPTKTQAEDDNWVYDDNCADDGWEEEDSLEVLEVSQPFQTRKVPTRSRSILDGSHADVNASEQGHEVYMVDLGSNYQTDVVLNTQQQQQHNENSDAPSNSDLESPRSVETRKPPKKKELVRAAQILQAMSFESYHDEYNSEPEDPQKEQRNHRGIVPSIAVNHQDSSSSSSKKPGIVGEYLADGHRIWHPKRKDGRRFNGTAYVLNTAFSNLRKSNDSSNESKPNPPPTHIGEGFVPTHGVRYSTDSSENAPKDEKDESTDKDIRRSQLVTSARQYKFYRCDSDMRGLIRLALPFTIHSLVAHIFELLQLAVIGRMLGTQALSALLIVDLIFSLSTMFLEGSLTSLFTLCSQAVGAQQYHLAGQYVQIAVSFYMILLLPMGAIWYFLLKDTVLLFGFSQEVGALAFSYAQVYFVSMCFEVITEALQYILEVTGHEIYTASFTIIRGVVDFLLLLLLASKFDPSLQQVAILGLASELVFGACNLAIIVSRGWLSEYWSGILFNFAPSNRGALVLFFKTALPLSFGYILSYGEWELLTIFAGFMGPAEVASWALLGQIWSSIEEVSLAVGDAAEVRVANMLGSNQPHRAKNIAHKALFLGAIISVIVSILVVALQNKIPQWFTHDKTLQEMLGDLFYYVCIGNITLMFGSMAWTLLGAQGRYALATGLQLLGSWGVTLPLAAVFTLGLDFDLQGLACAVVIGYSFSGALNATFLMQSNWVDIAHKVSSEANCRDEQTTCASKDGTRSSSRLLCFDDMFWDDLPDFAQSAARVLGYSKKHWDTDELPTIIAECGWDDLQLDQQDAAILLGYHQSTWDEASSTSSPAFQDEGPLPFNGMDWSELPTFAKKAALALGYNQKMWDRDQDPNITQNKWNELSATQQDAASTLGYNQSKWDADSTIADKNLQSDGFYHSYDWASLPLEARFAAERLGYNSSRWDRQQYPEVFRLSWQELSFKERSAAAVLGYFEDQWDEIARQFGKTEDSNESKRKAAQASFFRPVGFHDSCHWVDLSDDVRLAAKRLGFNQSLWDNGRPSDTFIIFWEDLTYRERAAAVVLGYHEDIWDQMARELQ